MLRFPLLTSQPLLADHPGRDQTSLHLRRARLRARVGLVTRGEGDTEGGRLRGPHHYVGSFVFLGHGVSLDPILLPQPSK